jgi:hypothetical protein
VIIRTISLALLAAVCAAGPLSSDGPPIFPAQVIPVDPPLTAVMVVQCDHIIGMFATLKDGRLLLFNMKSHVDYDQVIRWGESGKHHATAETECVSTL